MQNNTDLFNEVLNQVLDSVTESMTDPIRENPLQSLADPRIAELLCAKAAMMQATLADRLNALSDENPQDLALSSRLLRTLVLMDRTQSRIARTRPQTSADPADLTVQREEAHRFLQTELALDPRPAAELLAAANKLGIAKRTLLRAKADLNISSHVTYRDDKSHCWMWKLSPAPTASPAAAPATP